MEAAKAEAAARKDLEWRKGVEMGGRLKQLESEVEASKKQREANEQANQVKRKQMELARVVEKERRQERFNE